MKVLLGTTNPSKRKYFEELLDGFDMEFYTLKDLKIAGEPEETGRNPEENAVIKARYYGRFFDTVICNDSGLYFDKLPPDDERQPGLHIRTPRGSRRLDDEEMIAYYGELIHSLGGRVEASYHNGFAVNCHGKIASCTESSKADAFYMIDTPSPKRQDGWPLDSLSLDRNTLTYFVDEDADGFDAKEEAQKKRRRGLLLRLLREASEPLEKGIILFGHQITGGIYEMNREKLKVQWKQEEAQAHIHGWDFSHIDGRYEEENDLPWNYELLVRKYLKKEMELLDYDTGGGEFLLSLGHPFAKTSATEGYPPNVKLCKEKLLPLGIRFMPCSDPSQVPFEDAAFDLIINRHGSFDPGEIYRLLRKDGMFITEQVGADNERDLVEMVLPGTEKPFPHNTLAEQREKFEKAGFQILQAEETLRPILFYDIGAFVWFARIIEWEFPGFSVEKCFDRLCRMQEILERDGKIQGTIHRYLIVAKK